MKVIILAAGIGSRLGKPHPKALTLLSNGRSIMQNQIKALLRYVSIDDITVVVGFKKELIMEAFPELLFVYNDYFDTTNTSKSLLRGLKKARGHDVIWINGDVVFDHVVLDRLIREKHSCMAVNTAVVGEEEVKYTMHENGYIAEVSKQVESPVGEAVGINKVSQEDAALLLEMLEQCGDMDYFEKAIETAIPNGMNVVPVDISDVICTEIDFEEDLMRVNELLGK
ncbi:NTP transferase domain-containing protein [Paenibacillus sp. OV219]|uniref:phosphocholine cytidylyltransferase family protein n=1 Tax=Paenibacillus sp. OV219 TaxID=1884377 RepID=UPI0008CF0D39|nr:phosphocholine cytidylyltransferase family protein [Paenibacillus sp. OV219]SEN65260.1 Choline kinase [Paenibacillus sp. OV219]